MFQGFYIITEDCIGEKTHPDGWTGPIKKGTPIALTCFDEYGMDFIGVKDETDQMESDQYPEFRLEKPCPIIAACSCPHCGEIVPTSSIHTHIESNENCKRVRATFQKASESPKVTTFTIEEIKAYLEGCRFQLKNEWNHALNAAILELTDTEDGIEAVTERNRNSTEDKWRLPEGAMIVKQETPDKPTFTIEQVLMCLGRFSDLPIDKIRTAINHPNYGLEMWSKQREIELNKQRGTK